MSESDTDVDTATDVPQEDVAVGEAGPSITINPGELAEGIAGASNEELNLILEALQQLTFPSWDAKILAGQFQRRVLFTLEGRQSET